MSKLSLPPLNGLPSDAQAAFRAIAAWANTVQSSPAVQQTTVAKYETKSVAQTSRDIASIAEQVANRIVGRRSGDLMLDILQNSGALPAIEMNAPALFKATNRVSSRTHAVYIGAGGLVGAYQDDGQDMVQTFSVAASDGSFSFGAEDPANTADPAHRQIVYDASANVITFGSDIVVQRSNGTTMTLDDLANSSAGYTTADLQNDLASGVANVVAGIGGDYSMIVDPTNGFITSGRVGSIYKGTAAAGINRPAIGISSAGIAMGYNRASDGLWIDSVAIDSSGNASFSGAINATSGNFVDSVTVGGVTMATIKAGAASGATAVQPAALAGYATASSIANLIDRTAATTLSGTITPASGVANAGAFKIGTITWNTAGALTSGSGIAITAGGIIGAKGGIATFSIDTSGNAVFKGDVTGATGAFAGTVSAAKLTAGTITSAVSINSAGSINATGIYGSALGNVAIVGAPTSTGHGVGGIESGNSGHAGVYGKSATSLGYGVFSSGTFGTDTSALVPYLNAQYLNGKQSSDFLLAAATAADSSKLGGTVAANFMKWTGAAAVPGAVSSNYTLQCTLGGYTVRVLVAYP